MFPVWNMRSLKHVSVLAYHRVYPLEPNYPFNDETISVTPEQFREQLTFIKKYFHVTNFLQLVAAEKNNQAIPPNSLIMTFDDGYADNFEWMLPIIKEFDLTAVVYVSVDYLGTNNPFWFDEIAYLINHTKVKKISICGGQHTLEITSDNRLQVRKKIGMIARLLADRERFELMDEVRAQSEVTINPDDIVKAKPLNWDEVIGLHSAGIEIGSHSLSHGFLDRMTEAEIKIQVEESKRILEEKLQAPIVSFSFPNGDFDKRVTEAVRVANYKFAVGYRHAVACFDESIRFQIPRIHVETDVSLPLFQANLLLPEIFLKQTN